MTTLFLLGRKGLETLIKLEPKNRMFISEVLIGVDKYVINDYAPDIQSFCLKNDIKHSISGKEQSFHSKYAIAIGWKKLIHYNDGQQLIVFHDSILPRLRGFNPLVTALINGDNEVGVTALFASKEYDRGAIVDVEKINIEYPLKIEDAIEMISECYALLGNKILSQLRTEQTLVSHRQDEAKATYSLWRNEDDYFINWKEDAEKIARHIDAVGFPYNGAKTQLNNETITIVNALPMEDVVIENRSVGKIIFKIDNYPVVVCGKGLLMIKKAKTAQDEILDFKNKFRLKFK